MPKYPFSRASAANLNTCRAELADVFHDVADIIDCTIICGVRGKKEQDEAFRQGLSQFKFPNSKHNPRGFVTSSAVDAAPYPIDWSDIGRFKFFAGIVISVAHMNGVEIRWGGDWDSDRDFSDQTFMDYAHFELVDS